jgi:hypothetical protein
MANIDEDLAKILSSRYGKDVRQAIHDSIYDINEIAESQLSNIEADMLAAADSAQSANAAADNALLSEQSASTAATTATNAAQSAHTDATSASADATTASQAATSATTAATSASSSEANAKIWSDRAVDAAQSMSGGLVPKGSIYFADLPSISDSSIGDLYVILDNFTSTSDFEDGGGEDYSAGTKVYLTSSYKWATEPSSTIVASDLLVTFDEL